MEVLMSHTVVVSGIGAVAPNGKNSEEYWSALNNHRVTPVECPFIEAKHAKNRLYYLIPDWQFQNTQASRRIRIGRVTDFAIEASRMCLKDAGIDRGLEKIGVAVGTGMGDNDTIDAAYLQNGQINGYEAFCYNIDSVLASYFGFSGPSISVSTACSAGAYGISLAVELIRQGEAELMLVVGADGFLRVSYEIFNRIGVLDNEICRPFDRNRKGTIFGEGATALMLESKEHAMERGKDRYYAEIAGSGWSCDGYHPTAPEPSCEQTAIAIRRALAEAEITPEQIDCILPHATGTELNDLLESETLFRVFGDGIERIPIMALKSHIGHSGGAAGSFSCLTAVQIMKYGLIPPTLNWTEVDPRCRVTLSHQSQKQKVNHVLINIYGFGANNISVVMRKGTV
jgi:3-oxoacyl-[acyl-carrier-protein] synthase II